MIIIEQDADKILHLRIHKVIYSMINIRQMSSIHPWQIKLKVYELLTSYYFNVE